MKQKILLVAVTILSISGVYAQKVTVENGKMIIDASALKLHTSIQKSRTTDATLNTRGTEDLTNISSNASDAKVYEKFEIRKVYIGEGSYPMVEYTWLEAVKLCADLVDEGTGWRLPTRRELVLMRILEQEIRQHKFNGFTNLAGDIWSATETGAPSSASSVGFSGSNHKGTGTNIDKGTERRVRCIREIVEP